jgi:hypothetical protein
VQAATILFRRSVTSFTTVRRLQWHVASRRGASRLSAVAPKCTDNVPQQGDVT